MRPLTNKELSRHNFFYKNDKYSFEKEDNISSRDSHQLFSHLNNMNLIRLLIRRIHLWGRE
jgi:hypothetical protein